MPPLRSLVRLALLAGGAWLLWTAFALDAAWFERHVAGPALFLPPPRWFHPMLRALPAVFGVVLLATAGPLSRLQAGNLARILLAVLLACGVAELRLHRTASSPWRELKLEMKLGEA